jgi:sulfate adenylyltransferase subunit 1 (EFTu-like GTPase family)
VADRDGVSGDQINVYADGVQTLVASGSIAVGDRVKCAAAGKVSTLTAGTDAYDRLVGKALTAATDGNPVDILFP